MAKTFYYDVELLRQIIALMGPVTTVLKEQPDVPLNITAVNTGETNVLLMNTASTRFLIRDLVLKCADPGANTITVRLYKLVNDVLLLVNTFDITQAGVNPFGNFYTLTDMFGIPTIGGDNIQVTVRASAGGPYVVTGQYSHAKSL